MAARYRRSAKAVERANEQLQDTIAADGDTAKAGEPLLVDWKGPDYKNDYISVADVGAKGGKYHYYTYTREGSPLRLKMPLDPGEYEVRYILNQDNVIKAKQTIKVEPVDVSLDFADVAKEHSQCPSSAKGGDLGTFGQGQMVPEFDQVVFNDDLNTVHGPVKTLFGYHLLEITARTE